VVEDGGELGGRCSEDVELRLYLLEVGVVRIVRDGLRGCWLCEACTRPVWSGWLLWKGIAPRAMERSMSEKRRGKVARRVGSLRPKRSLRGRWLLDVGVVLFGCECWLNRAWVGIAWALSDLNRRST
jgi:hypothetical protein